MHQAEAELPLRAAAVEAVVIVAAVGGAVAVTTNPVRIARANCMRSMAAVEKALQGAVAPRPFCWVGQLAKKRKALKGVRGPCGRISGPSILLGRAVQQAAYFEDSEFEGYKGSTISCKS